MSPCPVGSRTTCAFRPAFRPCPARLSFIPTARHRRRDRGPKGRAGVGSKIREHRLHPLHRPGAARATSWSFRGGMEHEAWFREDTEVIDFFAPPRDDFLLGGKPAYMTEG